MQTSTTPTAAAAISEPQPTIIAISLSQLKDAMKLIEKAIAQNPAHIKNTLLMRVIGNHLYLSDPLKIMRITLKDCLHTGNDIAVAIESKPLISLLKSAQDQVLEINITQKNVKIGLWQDKFYGTFNFGTIDITQFVPHQAEPISNHQTIQINAQQLRIGIDKTNFATSDDDLRPAMTGILLHHQPRTTSFVATNALILAKYTTTKPEKDPDQPEHQLILPRQLLKLLIPTLSQTHPDTDIQIHYTDKQIEVNIGDDKTINMNAIAYKFPDYQKVIPTNAPNTLSANRLNLITITRLLSGFTGEQNALIMQLNHAQVYLKTAYSEYNTNYAIMELKSSYTGIKTDKGAEKGKKMDIYLNAKYLQRSLLKIDAEIIDIAIQDDPTNAIIISPKNNEPSKLNDEQSKPNDGTMTILIMPIRHYPN